MKSRLFNYYPLKNVTESINSDIKRFGVNKTMAKLIKKCGTKLEVVNKTDSLVKILKGKPVVVVANHPAQADVLAILAALPNRENIRMVMSACFYDVCKKFDKYIIPVHILNRLVDKGEIRNVQILKKISSFPFLSPEEERQKNIESIKVAGKVIKMGGLVIIFPGAGSKSEKWLNGVGYLIKNSEKKAGVFIVKAYIEGTSGWDFLRIIPFLAKLMPKFRVTFSQARDVSDYWSDDPKMTTVNIEADFNSWSEQLKKIPVYLPNRSLAVLRSVFFWLMMKGH